jgi:hypothetical protein
MTRLRIAFLFFAVLAGYYAAAMLIHGRLRHFGVAAAICAASSLAAGLIAYAEQGTRRGHFLARRSREQVRRGRAVIDARSDRQATTAAGHQCPSCGGARQKSSDSPRFADRQGARACKACAPSATRSRHDSAAGLK